MQPFNSSTHLVEIIAKKLLNTHMPPEARVCIINDDEVRVSNLSMFLDLQGRHSTVAVARTREEALELIPRFVELGVQVVLLDGNLTEGDESGCDGGEIARLIREEYPIGKDPLIKIVGASTSGYVEGVDVNYNPRKSIPEELVKIVTEI